MVAITGEIRGVDDAALFTRLHAWLLVGLAGERDTPTHSCVFMHA